MLADQLQVEYENRFALKREYVSVLKFDPRQARDEKGRWTDEDSASLANALKPEHAIQMGAVIDKLIEAFGDDWIPALAKLQHEGAIPFVLSGELDLKKLAKTPTFASILKYDPAQPRDAKGRWSAIKGRMDALKQTYPVVAKNFPKSVGTYDVGDPSNLEEHTSAVAQQWETQLTEQEMAGISERFGSDVEKLMQTAIPLHDIGKPEAIESGAGKQAQHEFTIPILQDVLRKEGFSEKDVALATEVMNHDLIGMLLDPRKGGSDAEVAAKLAAKAKTVGMDVADYATLQLAFYQADAASYPFITRYMHRDGKKWSFRGSKKIAAIEAMTRKSIAKFDPAQPRDKEGQWTKIAGRSFTSDEGYDWHEKGPGVAWAKTLIYKDIQALNNYSGFGYHDVNDLRRGTYKVPIKDYFVREATPEEMKRVGWNPEKNEWVPSIKVKEGEYKPGYEVDPRDKVTPENTARFGHPMGKREAKDYKPDDPYHQVEDGRIVIQAGYRPVEGGPEAFISIRRAGPDQERLQQLQKEADQLDDLIANRGLTLTEDVTVLRGAYLPGVTVEDLQDMELYSKVYEEKGFTSTFLGDAGGRARSYPALGKWESIHNRFGSGQLSDHQDEVGTAVQFHITLPTGTKVASIESVRRLDRKFPPLPDGSATDYSAEPTMTTESLQDKRTRSESEILIGSGARFRVTNVAGSYTYNTGDPKLKPVKVYQVHLEYIGGGSSQGKR